MSATTWVKWFWSDWMSDPGLRACGYAARGLWKDLLCVAAANDGAAHGFVLLNGRKPTSADLARMTNGTEAEVDALLPELERNGVFSRDRRGVIYCRRMVRAEKNRTNGLQGGNPKLLKKRENREPVGASPKAHKPEPESRSPTETRGGKPPSARTVEPWPLDYREQFWAMYPRRSGKKAAMAKLDAVAKAGRVAWRTVMDGLRRYVAHVMGTEERFIKHAATWVHGEHWDDEFTGPRSPDRPPRGHGPAGLALDFMAMGNDEEKH